MKKILIFLVAVFWSIVSSAASNTYNILDNTTVSASTVTSTVIKNGAGTAAAPSYSFSADTDTGIFNDSANAIGFSTGGTERWLINSSGAFNPITDNAYDIGNGTVNPRDITASRNLISKGGITGAGTYSSPVTLRNYKLWEDDTGYNTNVKQLKIHTTSPASEDAGNTIPTVINSSVSIGTSSSGNLDFPNALLATVPTSDFTQDLLCTLTGSQYAGSGNIAQRMYHILVRPDGSTISGYQVFDNSTANMITSVSFSAVNTTTLRMAITTGTAWGTGGGFSVVFGVCRTNGMLN